MITKEEMMHVLLDACPSYWPKWQAFRAEWGSEGDGLQYIALADFARHLISLLERGETAGIPAVFEAVERLHVEGEHFVKEAATVGLLEALQNGNLHRSTQPEQFRPFLGPESERWWDKLYRFWDHGELLTDD